MSGKSTLKAGRDFISGPQYLRNALLSRGRNISSMRILIIIGCLACSWSLSSQKMLRSGEWCAEGHLLPGKPPAAADTRSDSLDILHTAILLNLANAPQLAGECHIAFAALLDGVTEIRLDLESLIVDSVSIDGTQAPFLQSGASLVIPFLATPAGGDTFSVRIKYHGVPAADASGWGGVYNQNGYFFNLGVGFAADPHSFGRAWFPCFDNFVERSTFDFYITSGVNTPAYCNGTLADEMQQGGQITRHWKMEQPIPSYLACFTSGPLVSWKRNYLSIPVEIAAAAADTNKVAGTFQHLPQAIECFLHWYGSYRWPKIGYSLVPFNSGAMEHATNVSIGRVYIDGSLNYETLWAHELSHHWWGDLATCSTAEDMWLNEGWAVYSEHLFTEWTYGSNAFREAVQANFLNVLEKTHVNEGGYRAVSGLPHDLTYGEHVYNKGAVVAHNLRGYLGDSLFREGITSILEQTIFDDWSSEEMRDKLGAATGLDMSDFFNDWVFSPGFTHFSIDSVEALPGSNSFKLFVKQKLRGAPHFYQHVPLEFTFVNATWERIYRSAVVSGETSEVVLYLPAGFTPLFVWVNTRQQLTIARAEKEMVVKTTGNKNFSPAKMAINVAALPDSALIRVEHHYAMPDTAGAANPHGYLLSNRYWSIEADLPDGFDGSATVFYDGRGQMDQLDAELFAQTGPSEDSVLMVYRPGPGYPWVEYPTYFKNKLNSSIDRYGVLRIDHVVPGQYTVAKGLSTVGIKEPVEVVLPVKASPNPAVSYVRLSMEEPFDMLHAFNEQGEMILAQNFPGTTSIQVPLGGAVPAGKYIFVLYTKSGYAFCRVVVAR